MIYTDNSLKLVNILAKKIKNIKKKVLLRNNPNKTFKKKYKNLFSYFNNFFRLIIS